MLYSNNIVKGGQSMFWKSWFKKHKKKDDWNCCKKTTVGDIATPKVHKEIEEWVKYFDSGRY